jgi:peptidyl-prolyl cis-trans isomerase SurA
MEINELYQRMLDGEDFETLVAHYSDDKGSKDKGGMLPRFGSNRMVPEFIVAVDNIQDTGDISEPVLTSFGWHILKLHERKRPGEYKVEVLELKRKMTKDSRAAKSKESVIRRIKIDNSFKEYPENLRALFDAIDSSFYAVEWSADKVADMDKKILQLGKDKYTQHDFGVYLEKIQGKRGTASLESFFYREYHNYVNGLCIALEDKNLEEIYPEFRMLMNEYRDGILLFNLTDEKVWTKAIKDTLGLEEFYSDNRNNYMWGERLQASLIILNDPAQEDDIRKLITQATSQGENLIDAGLDTLENVILISDVFSLGDNSFIDKIAWVEGQSPSAPLTDHNDLYDGRKNNENTIIFAVVYSVIEPEPKTLDEARGMVTSDYQNFLEKEWINELKETYPVTVHENILEDIE